MRTVAEFDKDGFYVGTTDIDDEAIADHHVELPDGCDLEKGKYKWDGERFYHAVPRPEKPAPGPDALCAIALGMMVMHNSGALFPAATLKWLDHFATTMDFEPFRTPATDPEAFQVFKKFMHRGGVDVAA